MHRPLVYDATHLVSRLSRLAMTGIDRVDLTYARWLVENDRIACGSHYGLWQPHILSPQRMRRLVGRFDAKVADFEKAEDSTQWLALRAWLVGEGGAAPTRGKCRDEGWRALVRQSALRIAIDEWRAPQGALYLNVAQSAFEFPRFFRWLAHRPDVTPVFMAHDLLPLDFPEFFPAGYQDRFRRRVDTIVTHAKALVTSSDDVRERLEREYRARGRSAPPIHVGHLPSPVGHGREPRDDDPMLAARPYFVSIGTIEPRKNHLLILQEWTEIAERTGARLVLIGAPGWENAHILGLLNRRKSLQGCVRHEMGLPRDALRKLLANARALLMPSFAEGYGLPLAEALGLGAPVIASDIPIFREVTQKAATFIDPLDGPSWRETICAFADRENTVARAACEKTTHYTSPTHDVFFTKLMDFMYTL